MDDNDSTSGKRSGPAGQSTVPQGPLPAVVPSNATVLGSPLEGALQSSPTAAPAKIAATVAQTSFAAPASAITKTVTEIPQNIAAKTVTEIPAGIAANASIAPPPSRAKPAETIPLLPIVLGAGAMVAGVALFAIVLGSSKNTLQDAPLTPLIPGSVDMAHDSRNPWIRVEGAAGKVIGVSDNDLPASVHGFRPAQQVLAPSRPFEMQQHEVTWEEIDSWIEKDPTRAFPKPTTGLTSADARKSLPAYGVPWNTALDYCRAIGGTLPSEEQWELRREVPR